VGHERSVLACTQRSLLKAMAKSAMSKHYDNMRRERTSKLSPGVVFRDAYTQTRAGKEKRGSHTVHPLSTAFRALCSLMALRCLWYVHSFHGRYLALCA
jgi:hypothetical protein